LAGRQGFEPRYPGPEPGVLPLNDLPALQILRRDLNLDSTATGRDSASLNLEPRNTRGAGGRMAPPREDRMREIVADKSLVAYCGLYCGSCGSYLKGRCPGCHENTKASWCKVRTCCAENGYASCASCSVHTDPDTCKLFNNFMSKTIGVVLNSNRRASIVQIQKVGLDGHAAFMAEHRIQTLPRRGRIPT
jgi:hypothetical protein